MWEPGQIAKVRVMTRRTRPGTRPWGSSRPPSSTEKEYRICMILSLDPATSCCDWEPCEHRHGKTAYTPKARGLWQTGPSPGAEGIISAYALEEAEI